MTTFSNRLLSFENWLAMHYRPEEIARAVTHSELSREYHAQYTAYKNLMACVSAVPVENVQAMRAYYGKRYGDRD